MDGELEKVNESESEWIKAYDLTYLFQIDGHVGFEHRVFSLWNGGTPRDPFGLHQ